MTACSSLQSSQSQTPSLTREAKIVLMGFIPLERRLLPLFSTDRHPYVGTPTRILLQAAVRNSSCPSKNQTYKFRVSRKGWDDHIAITFTQSWRIFNVDLELTSLARTTDGSPIVVEVCSMRFKWKKIDVLSSKETATPMISARIHIVVTFRGNNESSFFCKLINFIKSMLPSLMTLSPKSIPASHSCFKTEFSSRFCKLINIYSGTRLLLNRLL
jgi:hypothetical protein